MPNPGSEDSLPGLVQLAENVGSKHKKARPTFAAVKSTVRSHAKDRPAGAIARPWARLGSASPSLTFHEASWPPVRRRQQEFSLAREAAPRTDRFSGLISIFARMSPAASFAVLKARSPWLCRWCA